MMDGSFLWERWVSGGLVASELTGRDWSVLVQYLLERGHCDEEVAELLGLDVAAVQGYAFCRVDSVQADIELERARDLERIEGLLRVWQPRALGGDARAAKVVLELLDYRMRLLRLDKGVSTDVAAARRWRELAQLRVIEGGSGGSDGEAGATVSG